MNISQHEHCSQIRIVIQSSAPTTQSAVLKCVIVESITHRGGLPPARPPGQAALGPQAQVGVKNRGNSSEFGREGEHWMVSSRLTFLTSGDPPPFDFAQDRPAGFRGLPVQDTALGQLCATPCMGQKPAHRNQNSEPSTQHTMEKTWTQPHTETQ